MRLKNLTDVLADDREHLVDNVARFARLMHELHQIEVDPNKFPSVSELSKEYVGHLVGTVCTEEQAAKIRKIYENVPERSAFLHGDCHPGNVMLQGGEFVLIDLAAGGMGHPIFGMVSMYSLFMVSSASEEQRMQTPHLRNFSLEECRLIWRTFISAYLDTNDEAFIKKAEQQIAVLVNARVILAAIAVPGLLTPERQRRLIDGACQAVDAGLEPICFG